MLRKIKKNKNYKFIVGLIVGGIIFGGLGVYGATVIAASKVSFTSKSGLTSTNVQDALDEAYQNATGKIIAYTYNQTSGSSTFCVTGEESTCVKTTCYKTKTEGSCPTGTIIKYKVNDNTRVVFHVLYDYGSTITMQSQKNTVYSIAWNSDGDNTKGPITALTALESATAGWSNVNKITYTAGTTTFYKSDRTGCVSYDFCMSYPYTLPSRTARARMITEPEVTKLTTCNTNSSSCPIWMKNYLGMSTSYGGTVNDNNYVADAPSSSGYWTMSAWIGSQKHAYYIFTAGNVPELAENSIRIDSRSLSARAVVEINK